MRLLFKAKTLYYLSRLSQHGLSTFLCSPILDVTIALCIVFSKEIDHFLSHLTHILYNKIKEIVL